MQKGSSADKQKQIYTNLLPVRYSQNLEIWYCLQQKELLCTARRR